MTTEQSKALMRRVTGEIGNEGRLELITELISDDLVDHLEMPGLGGSGQTRYRNHGEMTRGMFPDFRDELDRVGGGRHRRLVRARSSEPTTAR